VIWKTQSSVVVVAHIAEGSGGKEAPSACSNPTSCECHFNSWCPAARGKEKEPQWLIRPTGKLRYHPRSWVVNKDGSLWAGLRLATPPVASWILST
jgi:hypothetical protein